MSLGADRTTCLNELKAALRPIVDDAVDKPATEANLAALAEAIYAILTADAAVSITEADNPAMWSWLTAVAAKAGVPQTLPTLLAREGDMSGDVLRGLAFPFRVDGGGVAQSSGFQKVEEDVIHLLSVRLGERTMLRSYGGSVHGRRQHPNSPALAALVRHEIESALRTHMPDLRLTAPLTVVADEERLTVQIQYAAAPGDILRRIEVTLP